MTISHARGAALPSVALSDGPLGQPELQARRPDELMALYLGGLHPTSVRPLDGDPQGIPVGLHHLAGGRLERWLQRKAESDRFVWQGKSFRSLSDHDGWGYNRLGAGPFLDGLPFRTTITRSVFDGAPCIALDYRTRRTPRTLRNTWDELREVAPGIYLGPVTVRLFGRHVPVAWFGVDTAGHDPSHGV